MSENKTIPEVIYFNKDFMKYRMIEDYCTTKTIYYDIPYILKSKYDELELKVKELEESNEWISVKDRLPEIKNDNGVGGNKVSVQVLATTGEDCYVAILEAVRPDFKTIIWVIEVTDEIVSVYSGKPVTHWKPLPQPPKTT